MSCWCALLEYAVIAYLVIQLVRLVLADADLTLLYKEKFGCKPECLYGKVVWITGSSSGIGEYLAYDLARIGCKLVLSARRKEELERVKKQCLSQGCIQEENVMILPLDLLAFNTHAAAVKTVLNKFKKIDILVNNGGRSQRAMAENTVLEVDKQIMDVNYFGTLSLTKAVLPHMIDRKQGHIVVTSSVAGKIGAPFSASYSGSKFALQGWFDTLRLEQAINNIAVTMVCPGPVTSEITLHAFTDTPDKEWAAQDPPQRKMTTERCTELMTVAVANQMDEVWIGHHPVLLFVYIAQYMPAIQKYIAKKFGAKKIMKMRGSGKSR